MGLSEFFTTYRDWIGGVMALILFVACCKGIINTVEGILFWFKYHNIRYPKENIYTPYYRKQNFIQKGFFSSNRY